MSIFRASRYRLAPALPSLTEIQVSKFYTFLTEGIMPSLHTINPIRFPSKNVRLVIYPELYHVFLPTMVEEDTIVNKTTYSVTIYVPGHLFFGDIPLEEPQWINLGQIPMMTRDGHFIVNGRVRVLVHQILRRPGVYFKEQIREPGIGFRSQRLLIREAQIHEKRFLWADFICERGAWVRIQRDPKKRFWFCLKHRPKLPLDSVIQSMLAIENFLATGTKPLEQDQKQMLTLYFRLQSTTHPIAPGSSASFEGKTLKEGDEWKAPFLFLYKRFKKPRAYTLGQDGRYQINRRLKLTESTLQLTAHDLMRTKAAILDLAQYYTLPDDIDNLANRRVRSSSDYYQLRFQSGLLMLANTAKRRLELLKGLVSARELLDGRTFSLAFRGHFMTNPLSQILDQTNPLSEITHKRRIYATGPGGVTMDNATIDMRSIHPTYYGRICPIETPEGKRAGLVSSLAPLGRVDDDGAIYSPYYPVAGGQIQKRAGFFYMNSRQEQGSALRISPMDVARDFGQSLSEKVFIPARITTEVQEEFVNIPRDQVDFVGIEPIQFLSIGICLIPFLEHDDANRALMGSGMQRQTIPPIDPARPIVATGFESLVVGESGQALISDRTGIVSYVSGDLIQILSPPSLVKPFEESSFEEDPLFEEGSLPLPSLPTKLEVAPVGVSLPEKFGIPMTLPGFISTLPQQNLSDDHPIDDVMVEKDQLMIADWLMDMTQVWWSFEEGLRRRSLSSSSSSSFLSAFERKPALYSYPLKSYQRSNQETSLNQRPVVQEGQWVQKGDLLADCSASVGGQLAIGQNLLVAYVPWDGYNFEDAVVISERLVFDDLYTTLHIEKHETEVRRMEDSLDGWEIIHRDLVPGMTVWQDLVLDENGIIRIGSWVEPHDVLVRKFFRLKRPKVDPYERLLYDILERTPPAHQETSLRVPEGVSGRVVNVQILDTMPVTPSMREAFQKNKVPIPESLPKNVRVFIAETRRIVVGDKVAGRHGNKGVISCIAPRQDMPYLPDGRPTDMVLNPLGVPSRMNVGQVFECLLGLAGSYLQQEFRITPFDEIFGPETSRSIVFLKLYQARLKTRKAWLFQPGFPGKIPVFDGRNGHCFEQLVTVGCAYMLKLVHLVDEKIHARSTATYNILIEQPLKGRSKNGGQRMGEMEAWALEAYGAAYTLQEMLSLKSDDIEGRQHLIQTVIQPQWDLNAQRESSRNITIIKKNSRHYMDFWDELAIIGSTRTKKFNAFPSSSPSKRVFEEDPSMASSDNITGNQSKADKTTPSKGVFEEDPSKTSETRLPTTTEVTTEVADKASKKARRKASKETGRDLASDRDADEVMGIDPDEVNILKFFEAPNTEESTFLLPKHDPRTPPTLDFSLGLSEAFRVLLRELQSLCLDVGVYALSVPLPENEKFYHTEVQRSFSDYQDVDSEVPISQEEIFLFEPSDFVEREKKMRAARAAKKEMLEKAMKDQVMKYIWKLEGNLEKTEKPVKDVLDELEEQEWDRYNEKLTPIRLGFQEVDRLSEEEYKKLGDSVNSHLYSRILPLRRMQYQEAFIEEVRTKLNILKVDKLWKDFFKPLKELNKTVRFHEGLNLRRSLWKNKAVWSAIPLSKKEIKDVIEATRKTYERAIDIDLLNIVKSELLRRGYYISEKRRIFHPSLRMSLLKDLKNIAIQLEEDGGTKKEEASRTLLKKAYAEGLVNFAEERLPEEKLPKLREEMLEHFLSTHKKPSPSRKKIVTITESVKYIPAKKELWPLKKKRARPQAIPAPKPIMEKPLVWQPSLSQPELSELALKLPFWRLWRCMLLDAFEGDNTPSNS